MLIISRHQSQNDYLREWLPRRQDYLARILELEAPPDPRVCSHCLSGDGSWKCLDCLETPILCSACCRTSHRSNVFHRVEHWNGEFYTPAWLRQVGVVIHLGHRGLECPAYSSSGSLPRVVSPSAEDTNQEEEWVGEPDDDDPDGPTGYLHNSPPAAGETDSAGNPYLVLVDRSGIHQLAVRWCCCADCLPHDIQLLEMGLFPASFGRIRTAFTFKVLDDFLVDNLECKTSAFNFYNKLRRITSKAFPHKVFVSAPARPADRAVLTRSRGVGPISGIDEGMPSVALIEIQEMVWLWT